MRGCFFVGDPVLEPVLNYSGLSIMCRVAYALALRGVNIRIELTNQMLEQMMLPE